MSTGLFDWLGAEQNLTVLAGRAWERELEFVDTTDGGREGMDVSDVTFDGVVTGADGSEVGIEVSHRDEGNLLLVVFPALEAGVYRWELRAVDDSGEKRRMMYGRLGVLATRLDLEREASDEVEAQRMVVKVPGRDARRIMAEWRATTRALMAAAEAEAALGQVREFELDVKGYAEAAAGSAAAAAASAAEAAESAANVRASAKEIAEEATQATRERLEELMDDTEETRQSAEATVEKLEGFLAKFADNVRSVVWVNPENDHLIIGGVDTECKVSGDPGKSPYVDENGDWQYWDDESAQWRNGGPARGEDGFAPYVDAEWHLVYRDPLTGEVVRSAQAIKGKDGLDARAIRRIVVQRVADIPMQGETCNGGYYYYVPASGGGYDIYAWLEDPSGGASWVHVGEADDLATTEVYGLVKLGTDAVVQDGAPVGTDESGHMRVPAADMAQRGTVRLSLNGRLDGDGGGIGVDGEGRIWAKAATRTTYGSVKTSYTGSNQLTPSVGMNADGQLMVPYAGLNNPGVVNLGSYGGQSNPKPYIMAVGVDEQHRLANNLVYGGALQHMNPTGWLARNMPWLDAAHAEHPEYFVDLYYIGLVTSEQFTQSAEEGVVLLSATSTLKAGVFLARNMEDERVDAVPRAGLVVDWVHGECYTKAEVDEKLGDVRQDARDYVEGEVRKLNGTISSKENALSERIAANAERFGQYTSTEGMKQYVGGQLAGYETTNSLLARGYATKEMVSALEGRYIECTDNVRKMYVLGPDEFEASRGKRDAKGIYIKATM